MQSAQPVRPQVVRAFGATLLTAWLGLAAGCAGQTNDIGPVASPVVSNIAEAATSVPTTQLPEQPNQLDPAVAELEATISEHRTGALQLIEQNGGCEEDFIERCIPNTLMFVAPDSPAIEPTYLDLVELQEQQLTDFYAGVAAAEAEEASAKERELAEFYAGVAAAEAEEERELARFYAGVARTEAARAQADAEAEAVRQGEALVDRVCGGRRGWYFWEIDPVRVWLDRCEQDGRWTGSGGGGGDLDCDDIGYEFEIDPADDPNNLDGDGDGIACEGW